MQKIIALISDFENRHPTKNNKKVANDFKLLFFVILYAELTRVVFLLGADNGQSGSAGFRQGRSI